MTARISQGASVALIESGQGPEAVDGLRSGSPPTEPRSNSAGVARRLVQTVVVFRALARRTQPALPPVLAQADLRLDPARREATRAGRPLELGPKEFAVLQLLLEARGTVVSAEDLLERAWDEMADPFTNTVKMTISRLRAKLGEPPVIITVPQAGYRI